MPDFIDTVLDQLAVLISTERFAELESDGLEIKPIPSDSGSWNECYKSVNAFLNTRGGILLLGIREMGQGDARRYVFTGYRENAEGKLKELPDLFEDPHGVKLDLREQFPAMQLRDFRGGRVAVVWVDELPADRKHVFHKGKAWKRVLTGDHQISRAELEAQDAYREEAWQAREVQPLGSIGLDDLDLDQINEYIQLLNRPVRIETIKAYLDAARPFLERKSFLKDGAATLLGALVCGRHPADLLGFRCHVHGYVDVPYEVAQDKQDLTGNILPLMDASRSYILRNIQVGVSVAGGGTSSPQYPEAVIRETVNNALAHRDYSINKQAVIAIQPGVQLSIQNPGRFRSYLLIEHPQHAIPLRRVIPEAKARNPKLADVLRVYRRWEGRGIGMATLVNLCLDNQIDIPTYRLYSEEVCLILRPGKLCCDRIETRLREFDAYIDDKTGGLPLSPEQKSVIAYLMKSEWANQRAHYSILLTPDNNHFEQLLWLEKCGLISQHPMSTPVYPIYVVDRVLIQDGYQAELQELFGAAVRELDELNRAVLDVVFRQGKYSRAHATTAKSAAFSLWYDRRGGSESIREFDSFYRRVRYGFNKLERAGFIVRASGARGFVLNSEFRSERLL